MTQLLLQLTTLHHSYSEGGCCVEAETVLYGGTCTNDVQAPDSPFEGEKEGSLSEVEAPPCWYSLSHRRPTRYLHVVPPGQLWSVHVLAHGWLQAKFELVAHMWEVHYCRRKHSEVG